MTSWFDYFRRGLKREYPTDRLGDRKGRGDIHHNLQNLKPFLTRYWRPMAVGLGLVILTSLLIYPQPLINRYLIDDVILGKRIDLLLGALLLLATLKGGEKLVAALQRFYFTRLEESVLLEIERELIDRTLHFPKSFFDEQETGYLLSRLSSDVQGLRWFFSGTLVSVVSNLFKFVGGIALLFYLKWQLALAALILIPALVALLRLFYRQLRVLSHQGMEQRARISRRMQETLASTSLIKAFASESRTVDRVMSEWETARQLVLERASVGSFAALAINLLPDIARGLVVALGAYWIVLGEWTLGSMMAFLGYLGYVYGPAQSLAATHLQLQDALAALERVSALFDIVPEDNLGTGVAVDRLEGDIEFRDVSFTYDGREMVLEGLNGHVRPGEYIAIVGPSGVGKTTLVSLILLFYRPTSGEIWIDGKPANEYELGSLRRRIGYVSQRTRLLSGTIAENLRYGNPEASMEQIKEAARIAGIHDTIVEFPEGYESPLGEQGVNLSEGQRQRLSIARALVKEPDILVLDEPASALDGILERAIFDALPSLMRKKTLFVVAHRLSTARKADRIMLLNEKQLLATGTHADLMESNAYYRSLFSQSRSTPDRLS